MKPHLKTQNGVQHVVGDIHDIVKLFLELKGINILKDDKTSDELWNSLLIYIDNLAGNPDYHNYN